MTVDPTTLQTARHNAKEHAMTDILNQIDATLADVLSCACGCGKSISEKGPSGDFYNEDCQARWMRRRMGAYVTPPPPAGNSPAPLLTLDDVAVARFELRERTPEERIAFLAEHRARHVALGAPPAWLEAFDALVAGDDVTVMPAAQFDELMATIDEPDEAPALRRAFERRHPTMAEMNAASEAVRARREAPPTVTVLTDTQAAELTRRRETLSLECAAATDRCAGCDGAASEGWSPCLHSCHEDEDQTDEAVVDFVESTLGVELDPSQRRLLLAVVASSDEPLVRRPWWRRLLGGGAR